MGLVEPLHSVDALANVRAMDARQADVQGPTSSFEYFSANLPDDPLARGDQHSMRSVSEGEGIAAFALLACGQSLSRSNSRCETVPNRVDSGIWGDLLASGGESVPPNAGGRGVATEGTSGDRRSTSDSSKESISSSSSSTGSSNSCGAGDVRVSAMSMGNDPGPMPSLPPFGGSKSSASSGAGRKPPGSVRKAQHTNQSLLSPPFEERCVAGPSWGRVQAHVPPSARGYEHNGSGFGGRGGRKGDAGGGGAGGGGGGGEGGGGGGGGGGGEGGGDAWRVQTDTDTFMLRQQSFDPQKDIDEYILPQWPKPGPVTTVASATAGRYSDGPASGVEVTIATEARRYAHGVAGEDWGTVARGGDERNTHDALGNEAASAPCPARPPQQSFPQVWTLTTGDAPSTTKRADTPPAAGGYGIDVPTTTVTSAWMPATPAVEVDHARKPSYDLLAMMIPNLNKLGSNGGGGGGGGVAVSGRGDVSLHTSPPVHSLGVVGGGTEVARMQSVPALTGKSDVFSPQGGRSGSPVGGVVAHVGVGEGGAIGGTAGLLTPRQEALARYRRKRKRRPFVKAERERDPNRHIQNKSRVRPRQKGKFCKKGQDFVSITRVQAPADGRFSSFEIPVANPGPGASLSREQEDDDEGDGSDSTARHPAGSDNSYGSDGEQ